MRSLDVIYLLIKLLALVNLIAPILIAFIKKKYRIIAIEAGIVACIIAVCWILDNYFDVWSFDIFMIFNAMLILFSLIMPIVIGLTQKKYRIILAEAIVGLSIVTAFSLCPRCFPYVDSWIIGKTRDEITAVYGEPTGYDWSGMISYYIGPDNGFFGIMTSNLDMHYYIDFDQNGEACNIYYGCQLGG